jgi:hypothetical protein
MVIFTRAKIHVLRSSSSAFNDVVTVVGVDPREWFHRSAHEILLDVDVEVTVTATSDGASSRHQNFSSS